jgi:hypothetical protein
MNLNSGGVEFHLSNTMSTYSNQMPKYEVWVDLWKIGL